MAFHDLREFLEHLSAHGQLLDIDAPVSPELESAALSLRALRESGPALRLGATGTASRDARRWRRRNRSEGGCRTKRREHSRRFRMSDGLGVHQSTGASLR